MRLVLTIVLFSTGIARADDADGARAGAVDVKLGETASDTVGGDDRADWKRLQLPGAGFAACELAWDAPAADLALELYGDGAAALAATPPRDGASTRKRVALEVEAPGLAYIKVAALAGAAKYTVRCRFVALAAGAAEDPMNPRCRVLQSFRADDGSLELQLDIGFSKNVVVGAAGELFAGSSDNVVEGSLFTITKVVDATHSVARSRTLPRVGKNTRCVIHVAP